jgi:hypothetical protein
VTFRFLQPLLKLGAGHSLFIFNNVYLLTHDVERTVDDPYYSSSPAKTPFTQYLSQYLSLDTSGQTAIL